MHLHSHSLRIQTISAIQIDMDLLIQKKSSGLTCMVNLSAGNCALDGRDTPVASRATRMCCKELTSRTCGTYFTGLQSPSWKRQSRGRQHHCPRHSSSFSCSLKLVSRVRPCYESYDMRYVTNRYYYCVATISY